MAENEYDFEKQAQKGEQYEQEFFLYLETKEQNPIRNNPNGDNRDYDIIANGKTYEVKVDCYNNKRFPIELCHLTKGLWAKNGWLYVTKAEYIVFYKEKLGLRYYFKTEKLKEFMANNLLNLQDIKPTPNKNKVTWNAYLTESELESAGILFRTEEFGDAHAV